jgi:hypothetical protein
VIVLSCSNRFPLSKSDSLDKQNKEKSSLLISYSTYVTSGSSFFRFSIQPIYYQQPPTTTLLTAAGTPQTLSTLIPNQTGASLNGAHTSQHQSNGGPSYYELTYATAPLTSSIEQPSYIYTTASGQTFSYAQLPNGAGQQQTGPTNLNDVYANHTAKYMIDDHSGSVDRDHHQRAAAGW